MHNLPDHQKISFTAKLVALGRSTTNIPFAREVSTLVDAPAVGEELQRDAGTRFGVAPTMAPFVEARYWSLVSAIKQSGVRQVLEFASGISLRGLAMALERQSLTYIETDLPDLTAEKRHLVDTLLTRRGILAPANHHITVANILDWSQIEAAVRPLDRTVPLAVVHEGLFMYLSQAEKDVAAEHIGRLLDRFGGVWITPDFSPMASLATLVGKNDTEFARSTAAIEARTGRPFDEHSFATEAEALAFCARHGFVVAERPQIDGSFELTSLAAADDPELLGRMRAELKLWHMRRE